MTKAAVLIVEEEALIRMENVDVVKDAGFTALEAVDADEAVKISVFGAIFGLFSWMSKSQVRWMD